MSTLESLPVHWQFYAERSRDTHFGRLDEFGYGREELLWETLALIEASVALSETCCRRLERIPQNRAKKHRRLRLYLFRRSSLGCSSDVSSAELADSVEQVRRMMSADEWEIETRLAAGQTFAEVAHDCGVSPETLKVRASRWRARIRRVLAA